MSEKETKLGQEPAFPMVNSEGLPGFIPELNSDFTEKNYTNGMSKRFLTAKDIFCALISNADRHSQEGNCHTWNYEQLSAIAFLAADELLKQE